MDELKNLIILADQADEAAAKAVSPVARHAWQSIAREYRKIAALQRSRREPDTQGPQTSLRQ